MKIPKHYSLVKEHPASYEIHDSRDDKKFHIAKSGLDLDMHGKLAGIKKFAEGGQDEVDRSVDDVLGSSADNQAGSDAAQAQMRNDQARALSEQAAASAPQVQRAPAATAAPIAPAQAPDSMSQYALKRGTSLNDLENNVKGAVSAEQAAHKGLANEWKGYADQVEALPSVEDITAQHADANKKALEAYQSKQIDPDHYWNNKSVGAKIGAALGMILGGASAGTLGGPNMAAQTIHNEIDADIDAQKNDQSKKMNLYKMNLEATKNDQEANLMTRNQLLTAVQAKAQMYAAQSGGAEAQLKLAPMIMEIEQQKAKNNLLLGMQQGGNSNIDPASLIPLFVQNPEQQQKVAAAIDVADTVKRTKQRALDLFDKAAAANTVMRTGGGMLRTPPEMGALHEIALPLFTEIEGTARQAAMDAHQKNTDPHPGDLPSTTAVRRKALENWMDSKHAEASSIAKANGIDLNKFNRTSNVPSMGASNSLEGKTASDANGNRIIMQGGRWVKVGG